jgi:hypothetical protein
MVVKETLCESTGVRHTKSGDILVELEAGVKGGDIALKVKEVMWGKVLVSPCRVMYRRRLGTSTRWKVGRTSDTTSLVG